MDINLSRRAGLAIRPLKMGRKLRSHFVETVVSSATFDTLPDWAKEITKYGEQYKNAPENSVSVPKRLFPEGYT